MTKALNLVARSLGSDLQSSRGGGCTASRVMGQQPEMSPWPVSAYSPALHLASPEWRSRASLELRSSFQMNPLSSKLLPSRPECDNAGRDGDRARPQTFCWMLQVISVPWMCNFNHQCSENLTDLFISESNTPYFPSFSSKLKMATSCQSLNVKSAFFLYTCHILFPLFGTPFIFFSYCENLSS